MSAQSPKPITSRVALRKSMRRARRAVVGAARAEAEASIVHHIRANPVFRAARRVGTFMAFDGEPELAPLIGLSPRHEFFIPVIDQRSMRFAALDTAAGQHRNFFGIAEPRKPRFVQSTTLDLVLTPLVAFDDHGVRVGVGRGYYDRCFAYLGSRRLWLRPKLLGVAFACQHVNFIAANSWDVPLWGVVTEDSLRIFN
jgi:5-formyltetrahydrofolate cyclo-ligase